jgi:apolipoprotein N-acyltransferase
MSSEKTTAAVRRKPVVDGPVVSVKPSPARSRGAWHTRTLPLALTGSLLMWAALPPLELSLLAWLAPLPWLVLVRKEKLPGRRPHLSLWLAGFLFWMAAIHWLRLPHPATSIGWVALSFYLAFYVPAFVAFARPAVHRLRLPLVVVAPVVWTGLELARGHLLTGFSMGLLGHTQYWWIELIQISDFGGAYAVSFSVMFVAACLARILPLEGQPRAFWPLVPAAALLAGLLFYGHATSSSTPTTLGPKVALIQGSIDTTLKADPNEVGQVHAQYIGLTQEALTAQPDIDLIVWPETMCRATLIECPADARPGTGGDWRTISDMRLRAADSRGELHRFSEAIGKRMLLGVDTYEYGVSGAGTRYNSAVWVDPGQGVVDRYDKMHPVMFGEYVPFADRFPWLYRLTPLGSGIGAGERLPAFELDGTRLAANICFESAVPHLIRRQVAQLRARSEEPDILVNLTNDGWFWGSSELDMHLACGVFRAVELRKPFLIAANTGFSAWIDSHGRIVKQGPRRATGVIIASVLLDRRQSFYSTYGDIFSGFCLAASLLFAVAGLWPRGGDDPQTADPGAA